VEALELCQLGVFHPAKDKAATGRRRASVRAQKALQLCSLHDRSRRLARGRYRRDGDLRRRRRLAPPASKVLQHRLERIGDVRARLIQRAPLADGLRHLDDLRHPPAIPCAPAQRRSQGTAAAALKGTGPPQSWLSSLTATQPLTRPPDTPKPTSRAGYLSPSGLLRRKPIVKGNGKALKTGAEDWKATNLAPAPGGRQEPSCHGRSQVLRHRKPPAAHHQPAPAATPARTPLAPDPAPLQPRHTHKATVLDVPICRQKGPKKR